MINSSFSALGIQYGGHDTSASLLVNGEIVTACEQERFDLVKHSRAFPIDAINECLKIAGLKDINQIDVVAYGADILDCIKKVYLEPALKDIKRIEFLLNDAERLKSFLNHESIIREKTSYKGKISFFRHHLCHLASAYYPSGFKDALLVSYDGMGEIETSMIGEGTNGNIKILNDENHYPHSLGLFYSAITYYLGWKHHCDEGIIMGLAPYGNPYDFINDTGKTYIDIFRKIISSVSDTKYEIDLSWIEYHNKRDTWISEKFIKYFGPKKEYNDNLTQHHKNIAAALQLRTEEIVLSQLKHFQKQTGKKNICISGGVGLNCSLNGKILNSKLFDEIFVQPASGDAGVSLGAAILASKDKFKVKKHHNFYLGASFTNKQIEKIINNKKIKYKTPEDIYKSVAKFLAEGKIVGWFQGSSEFGPRALGNRSILSRPYPVSQKDYINNRVKFREEFRPFAPAILKDYCQQYFHLDQESPHMLIACNVKKEKKDSISATVHVDESCRVQTVKKSNNEKFFNLLNAFKELTDCPVILNTSFNVKGQPIVNNPLQAIDTFLNTNIDVLAIGNFILNKENI